MASRRKQTRTMRRITSQTSAHSAWALKSLRWVSVVGLLVVDWANGNDEDEGEEEKVGSHAKVVYMVEDYAPWGICALALMVMACYCCRSYRSAASSVIEIEQAEKAENKGELKMEDVFHKREDVVSWTNVQQREGLREIRSFTEPSSNRSTTDRTTDLSSDPSPEPTGSRPRGQRKPPRVPVGNYSSSASDMEQQRLPMGKEDSQSNELQDGYDPRGTGLAGRKI